MFGLHDSPDDSSGDSPGLETTAHAQTQGRADSSQIKQIKGALCLAVHDAQVLSMGTGPKA